MTRLPAARRAAAHLLRALAARLDDRRTPPEPVHPAALRHPSYYQRATACDRLATVTPLPTATTEDDLW